MARSQGVHLLGLCVLAAGCGGNSSGGTDTTRAGPLDGGVATGCASPQGQRAVAQNCPPERGSIVPVDTTCLHHLDGGAGTTCGVAVSGKGTEEIEIDLGGCAAVLSLAYACHTMNDECINDSDCPAVGGYCAYVDEEKRWACNVCLIRNHL